MKKIFATVFCFCCLLTGYAQQQYPFYNDIQAFKQQDSIHPPVNDAILFIGSSSFTYWKDVAAYFPEHHIINRGFGGSSLPDVIHYANDVIFAYHPKQIVIYCGENDLATADTVTADSVVQRFCQLFTLIRSRMPDIPVTFVSLKPSPSRSRLMPRMVAANQAIKKYLRKQKHTSFVDVYHKMLQKDGTVKADIFKADQLHMNAQGYSIWQKAIAPALK
ncbi:GDSL-type esterase/lipase family protein [Chitinophaga sp.]|uniref:GDSL-type esterase/lipase family protein n=1 Tax=Chitinophaga sp. TaxID=1869181 RepID=UPI002F95550D